MIYFKYLNYYIFIRFVLLFLHFNYLVLDIIVIIYFLHNYIYKIIRNYNDYIYIKYLYHLKNSLFIHSLWNPLLFLL